MPVPPAADGPDEPSGGQVISHYRILRPLGGGGMGVVFAAEDLRLGRSVALKFLPRQLSADAKAIERFAAKRARRRRSVLLNGLSLRDGIARAKRAQGDLAGAAEEYRRLLTVDVSQKWTSVLEPRYVLQRARLLDRAGDGRTARREYERFLDLWRNADSGRPEAAEAMRALKAFDRLPRP
jgi:serine/threonine protein kinase